MVERGRAGGRQGEREEGREKISKMFTQLKAQFVLATVTYRLKTEHVRALVLDVPCFCLPS